MKYIFIFILGLLIGGYLSFISEDPIETSSTNITTSEMGLFLKANEERTEKLEWSYCLHFLAVERSKDMVERGYFGHEDPETEINESWNKIENNCGEYYRAGENLVRRHVDSEEGHSWLMGSKLHRENILEPNFTSMGVGCYQGVCTELFANFVQ